MIQRSMARMAILVCAVILAVSPVPAQTNARITSKNIAKYVGNGRWDWTVFISGSPGTIQKVKCVEYTLHPTFPNPVRRVCQTRDRRYPFALSTNGWGTFVIGIRVEMVDGEIVLLRHNLQFRTSLESGADGIEIRNIASPIGSGRWRWTAFVAAPESTIDEIRCVEYTLHPTFPNPEVEVCKKGSDRTPFGLTAVGWGVFELQARVVFKNGTVKELKHQLRFGDHR